MPPGGRALAARHVLLDPTVADDAAGIFAALDADAPDVWGTAVRAFQTR